jgi:hypothetical protein
MSAISRAVNALRQDFPARILGMGLLFATLDPFRLTDPPGLRWIAGAAALIAGCWAAPPLRERPAMTGYRLAARISRYRNTLLASVSVLLAATTTPPTWLMVADLALVLTYLSVLDLFGEAPGTPLPLGLHAVAAWVAAGVVLAAALVPVTGGWWGRIVAAAAVLVISALMYGALWLSRPATFHRTASAPEARRH